MTVDAEFFIVAWKFIDFFSADEMTSAAIDFGVATRERKSSAIVVKAFSVFINNIPARVDVTFRTFFSQKLSGELLNMRAFMANFASFLGE